MHHISILRSFYTLRARRLHFFILLNKKVGYWTYDDTKFDLLMLHKNTEIKYSFKNIIYFDFPFLMSHTSDALFVLLIKV